MDHRASHRAAHPDYRVPIDWRFGMRAFTFLLALTVLALCLTTYTSH